MFAFYGSYKASFSHPGEVHFLAGQALNIFSLVIILFVMSTHNSYFKSTKLISILDSDFNQHCLHVTKKNGKKVITE